MVPQQPQQQPPGLLGLVDMASIILQEKAIPDCRRQPQVILFGVSGVVVPHAFADAGPPCEDQQLVPVGKAPSTFEFLVRFVPDDDPWVVPT